MLRSSSTHFSLQFNSDVECEALSWLDGNSKRNHFKPVAF
jgi:hypothetical protein